MKTCGLITIFFAMQLPVFGQITWCGEHVPAERQEVAHGLKKALRLRRGEMGDSRLQQRAALYLPFIRMVLREYGLPEDLMYLAVSESRLQRRAISQAGAGGMWQFMPATAVGEGLRVNGAVDERGRVIKSTHAACRLLGKLYRQLNNWHLVAAAYNFGIGNLQRTIQRQGHADYYRLRLNKETASYLYNVLAFKLLYESSAPPADTTPMLPPLPGMPVASLSVAQVADTMVRQVEASLLRDTPAGAGQFAFVTVDTLRLGNYLLPRRSVVPTYVHGREGERIFATGAGIDIAPALQEFSITVLGIDGTEGIPARGRSAGHAAGQKVRLQFAKQ